MYVIEKSVVHESHENSKFPRSGACRYTQRCPGVVIPAVLDLALGGNQTFLVLKTWKV